MGQSHEREISEKRWMEDDKSKIKSLACKSNNSLEHAIENTSTQNCENLKVPKKNHNENIQVFIEAVMQFD